MKLTDDELVKIANQGADGSDPNGYRALFLAGKRAGREDMRERAAKALISVWRVDESCTCVTCETMRSAPAAIRALGVDDD